MAHHYQTHPLAPNQPLIPSNQQAKAEGLDYSLQRSGDVYSAMMPQTRAPLHNQGMSEPRRAQNQVYAYDHTTTQAESYNQAYNQISPPSRSPSGPTYTQLNSAIGTRGETIENISLELICIFLRHGMGTMARNCPIGSPCICFIGTTSCSPFSYCKPSSESCKSKSPSSAARAI